MQTEEQRLACPKNEAELVGDGSRTFLKNGTMDWALLVA